MQDAAIESMLARALPGARVVDVVARSGGELSSVVEARLADADPVIVKVYREAWAWGHDKEVALYARLAGELPGLVPTVLYTESPDAGRPFTVMTRSTACRCRRWRSTTPSGPRSTASSVRSSRGSTASRSLLTGT